jgi:hypothetical protein
VENTLFHTQSSKAIYKGDKLQNNKGHISSTDLVTHNAWAIAIRGRSRVWDLESFYSVQSLHRRSAGGR